MKKSVFFLLFAALAYFNPLQPAQALASASSDDEVHQTTNDHDDHNNHATADDHNADDHDTTAHHGGGHGDPHSAHGAHHETPKWLVIPFIALLLMIATGPLFYAHFWHHHYPKVAILLGVAVAAYYIFAMGNWHQPVHSGFEYVSFISLLTALFVASGGILLGWDKQGSPMANVIILVIGAAMANIIGTTGASMLLIRPFIKLNKGRIKPFHIVFFIFMVSNVGGCLTPIGDPPLFLGFLKGVPFEWTIVKVWPKWLFGIGLLALIFYFLDARDLKKNPVKGQKGQKFSGRIGLRGSRNIIFLVLTIGAVFLDPNKMDWVPYIGIEHDGHLTKFSFLRELIMLAIAGAAYFTSDKECLKRNEFNFEPIKEVAYLFIGIFLTMMPALELVGEFAKTNPDQISTNTLYWFTGALSGVLDNAPTYMNFLAAAIAKVGLDINSLTDVAAFASTEIVYLTAISVASVFFGAMTYIGNAPNFMVKAIAEQQGVEMPSFVAYVVRYSVPYLLPVLLLTWVVFFFF
ncbi:MAG: sodium:proton antiporter [Bacteroidetes bacterium]|nr:sodium:proton antiporter [Bacteroidota bacterium]